MTEHNCETTRVLVQFDDIGDQWVPTPPMKSSNIREQRAAEKKCASRHPAGNGHHLHENWEDDGGTWFCCDCGYTSWETYPPLVVLVYKALTTLQRKTP